MTLRKISDLSKSWNDPVCMCKSPDHKPPGMIVLEPGTYEHTCPDCGEITTFTVPPKATM